MLGCRGVITQCTVPILYFASHNVCYYLIVYCVLLYIFFHISVIFFVVFLWSDRNPASAIFILGLGLPFLCAYCFFYVVGLTLDFDMCRPMLKTL